MLRVKDFDLFGDNSSTTEALLDFVEEKQKTMRSLMMACWPKETKAFIRTHKDNPEEFRKVAYRWLRENFMNFVQ